MSQAANQITTTPPLPGATLVSAANGALAALLTQYSGTSAPSGPSVGQNWLDTSGSPIDILKTWDGTQWIVDGVLDTTNHQWYGPIGGGTATLASAATTNLGSVSQSQVSITGVVTITSFGSPTLPGNCGPGTVKFVTFAGILILTHSASLSLPGAANITTAAGDRLVAVYQGAGNWIVWSYTVAASSATPGIPSEATAEAGIDNTTAMSPLRTSQALLTNALVFANVAGRNGGLEVWQRGPSIAVAASTTAYGPDGWYLFTNANQAAVVSRQSGLTNGSSFSARVQRNAGQTGTGAMMFGFPLDTDELKKIAGKSIIIQIAASTGANWSPVSGTLSLVFSTGTGTPVKLSVGYTGGSTVLNQANNIAAGTAAAVYYSTVIAIAANIAQAEVTLFWSPTGTAGANDWFQLDDVDIRVVPSGLAAAKPSFERSDYYFDLQRCLRFAWSPIPGVQYSAATAIGQAASATSAVIHEKMPVRMRAAPTMTISALADFNAAATNGAPTAMATFAILRSAPDIVQLTLTTAAGMAAGAATFVYFANAAPVAGSLLYDASI